MFKVVNTWKNAAQPAQQNRGMPAPGVGQTNRARKTPGDGPPWINIAPLNGEFTWDPMADPVENQRGFPAPQGASQAYAPGQLTNPVPDGRQYYRETRQFSRGAQRWAPVTGYVLESPNPGVPVTAKPNVVPRYPLGQYVNNTIFWANQVIPTTVRLQGLQTEKAVAAILSTFQVYGMAETV